jgi:hypothetical protein
MKGVIAVERDADDAEAEMKQIQARIEQLAGKL